ncbi:MAG: hypothetical protein E7K05_24380 [Serratia marcescens]|nr:hypothetical protein [Serratia marcescens]
MKKDIVMAAWAFLIVGWLLIWRDYPIFGALCIALFAVLTLHNGEVRVLP